MAEKAGPARPPPTEDSPLLGSDHEDDDHIPEYGTLEDVDVLVREVRQAIDDGIHPEIIVQGSSGSYFVRNRNKEIVGVFKPKNEEPYGHLNPKWTKWIHKTCCPCLFGRSCLVPNQGYLSEAGAYIVDRRLHLGVVPPTRAVRLRSPAFNYDKPHRWLHDRFGRRLPSKLGSFQMFVRGFKDASSVLHMFAPDVISPALRASFQDQFERMIVLDYVTRNTDRGHENWLIKVEKRADSTDPHWPPDVDERVRIAAIDNGLSFPFKHPDSWRTYPYYWAWLPQAKQPFSDDTRDTLLPLLVDEGFVEGLIEELYEAFRRDKDFNKSVFRRQAAVMRGQILNLTTALKDKLSPWQLVQLPLCCINKDGQIKYIEMSDRVPCFSFC